MEGVEKIIVVIGGNKGNDMKWETREDKPRPLTQRLYSKIISSKEDLSWEEIKYLIARNAELQLMADNILSQVNMFK